MQLIIPCNRTCVHRSSVMVERNEHFTFFCLKAAVQNAKPPIDANQMCLWWVRGD